MKSKTLVMGSLLIGIGLSSAAFAAEKEAKLNVTGMFCGDCSGKVKGALEGKPGVKSVDVNMESNSATVKYDDSQTDPGKLADAVTDAGYEATVAQ